MESLMAGDWIKMRKTLLTDPRIVRMMSALKADRLRTVGGLLSAWCLADDHTEDGHLVGYTPEVLDEMVGFPGLANAMITVGWLEATEESLVFPRFEEHNGQTAKRRAQDAVRKMSARKADKPRTKSGLEKRREEKSITHTHTQRDEPRIPSELAECWATWSGYVFERFGEAVGAYEAETTCKRLLERGVAKAKRDVEFSIAKRAKSILDSDNDFEQHSKSRTSGGAKSGRSEIVEI